MKVKTPDVSVVLTVYNGEEYIDRAIPSILDQIYTNYELIIVDDGSTDKTPDLLAELAAEDNRIKVYTIDRLGRSKAINLGIEKAEGIYIAIQDIDDISYPNRLSTQVDFLNKHPRVGVVGGYYQLIDENREEKYVRMPPTEHNSIINAMCKYIPFAHTLVTLRKKAWQDVGGYPDVDNIIDLRMWIAIAEKGWKLANIPEIIGEHWVYKESFYHKKFKYKKRQRELAGVQASAVNKLNLAKWKYIFPLSRLIYPYIPDNIKRNIRRKFSGLKEKNI
ncbi:MAG: glycosyltransferase family 2 protein [Halanaerobiaceae bacterium]